MKCKPKKIGIFGGAFNPPHIGHTNAAKTVVNEKRLDLLIVIPTGIPPYKEMPPDTPPPKVRLEMTKNAFCGLVPSIRISELEIYSKENNYTIDTIRTLQKEYAGAELYLLVGNDMYDSLDTWKNSAELLDIVTPILLPRDVIDISSTQIRALLPERKGVEYLDDKNYSLIIKHRLYNALPSWDWLRKKAYAMLDSRRVAHVEGCETAAIKLAEHWGENVDDAREAAILHDITKRLDFSENMCIITESGLVTNSYKKGDEKLLHSITGAITAKSVFGVSDKVATAIRLHTTGVANMTLLQKIVYIADYIEETRDFPGVKELRRLAFENIDEAMIMGLQMTVNDLISRGIPVDKSTYDALRDLTDSVRYNT